MGMFKGSIPNGVNCPLGGIIDCEGPRSGFRATLISRHADDLKPGAVSDLKPLLAQTSELTRLDSGVWVAADEVRRSSIDYTDGDAKEAEVRRVIENARDLSCDSLELDRSWQEWALEYHLTSLRSNLLRGFDLVRASKVLEVGCGCGAITRYLGEQGLQIDAIEGSMQRAETARLRCRDLDNVNIVCSDYNHLQLPAGQYDLILFVGVLEYSGLYAPDGKSPEEQLVSTLTAARSALSSIGAIVIAIENRIGFKYLAGGNEDHLGMTYIGVREYPEVPGEDTRRTRGIRTYDKPKWEKLLEKAGIGNAHFSYPFPDYKLPEVLLSEGFASGNRYAFSPLHGIGSRDYLGQWRPEIDETLFWKAAAAGNFLDQAANSFLIVAGEESSGLAARIPFDFVRFSGRRRKPEYRLDIVKPTGRSVVLQRRRGGGAPAADTGDAVIHHMMETAYIKGELLSERWLETLKSYCEQGVWEALLKEYHAYLVRLFETAENPRTLMDALPNNIVVEGETGAWRLIDLEWEAKEEISVDFVFFRAVLQFGLWNRGALRFTRATEGVQTVGDFLASSFSCVGRAFSDQLDQFTEQENGFQRQVIRENYFRPVAELLTLRMYEIDADREEASEPVDRLLIPFQPYQVTAYWAESESLFCEERSTTVVPVTVEEGEQAEIVLPVEAARRRLLRIDPANHLLAACNSVFEFRCLTVDTVDDSGQRQTILRIDTVDELFNRAKLIDLARAEDERGGMLLVESYDPQIILNMGDGWAGEAKEIVVRFTLKWPYGDDYLRVRKLLSSEDELLARRVWEKRAALSKIEREVEALEARKAAAAPEGRPKSRLRRLLGR